MSVVISTYNRVSYLCQALASVEAQTFRDYEIIVVDDGSSDGTESTCRERFPDVRYIRQRNLGRSEARNTGIREARAELIAFLDDDDVWHPDKLRRQIAVMDREPEVGLVHSFTEIINRNGSHNARRTQDRLAEHREGLRLGYTFPVLGRFCVLFLSAVLVRGSVLEKSGLFDPDIPAFEDWDLYLRVAEVSRIATIPEALVQYRLHGGNSTPSEHLLGRVLAAEKHLTRLVGRSDRVASSARFGLLVNLARAHYMAGNGVGCRKRIAEAFREAPIQTLSTRLPLHFVLTTLPLGILKDIRHLRRQPN